MARMTVRGVAGIGARLPRWGFHLCFGDAVSGQLHHGEVTLPNCPFDIIETDPDRGFLSLCHHDHFQRQPESQNKSHDDHFTSALGSVSDTCEAGNQADAWRQRETTGLMRERPPHGQRSENARPARRGLPGRQQRGCRRRPLIGCRL